MIFWRSLFSFRNTDYVEIVNLRNLIIGVFLTNGIIFLLPRLNSQFSWWDILSLLIFSLGIALEVGLRTVCFSVAFYILKKEWLPVKASAKVLLPCLIVFSLCFFIFYTFPVFIINSSLTLWGVVVTIFFWIWIFCKIYNFSYAWTQKSKPKCFLICLVCVIILNWL